MNLLGSKLIGKQMDIGIIKINYFFILKTFIGHIDGAFLTHANAMAKTSSI
jgi:hypothetical protein